MTNKKNIAVIAIIGIIGLSAVVYTVEKYRYVQKNQVSVYFAKQVSETKNKVIPVKRQIKYDKVTTAITELLKGPSSGEKESGLFTEIPAKTKLLGIKQTPEKVEINLSNNFGSGGGSESMKLRLQQLSNTVIDASGKKPVYLDLNGKQAEFIGGEGLEISQPLVKF